MVKTKKFFWWSKKLLPERRGQECFIIKKHGTTGFMALIGFSDGLKINCNMQCITTNFYRSIKNGKKKCRICKKWKALSKFYLHKKRQVYLSYCKICHDNRSAVYRRLNPEKRTETCRQSYKKHSKEITSRNWKRRLDDFKYDLKIKMHQKRMYAKMREINKARGREAYIDNPERFKASMLMRKIPTPLNCSVCNSTRNVTKHFPIPEEPEKYQVLCRHCLMLKVNRERKAK